MGAGAAGRASGTAPRLGLREFEYWMRNYRRTWRLSVVKSFVNPLLFFAGIGIGLGRLIDRAGGSPEPGVGYLAYLAPGLLAAAALQTAAAESTFSAFQSLRARLNYRTAAASPLEPSDVLDGHLLFIAFRVFTCCLAFFAVAVCAGLARSPWVVLDPFVALLTGIAFAAPLLAYGVLVTRQGSISTLHRFLVMPVYLLSGTYAPVGRFPEPIRVLAYSLPLWHGVQLCRALDLGTPAPATAAAHVLYLLAVSGAGYWAARAAYARRLHD